MKWWKYAGRRKYFGVSIPFPRRLTSLRDLHGDHNGTTTLAFAFGGISIVLVCDAAWGLNYGPVVILSSRGGFVGSLGRDVDESPGRGGSYSVIQLTTD